MKFIHISDLHLGKRVKEFSMLEDQEYILNQILGIAEQEQPDLFLIAGDIYDKPLPPGEAVALFDRFLTGLWEKKVTVAVISGNHDSPERLSFGASLMEKSGVHIAPVFRGAMEYFTMEDAFGPVKIWLLPFLRPGMVRPYADVPIESYNDGVKWAVASGGMNPNERNILAAHQFVTGAVLSESEEITVGGLDNIEASVFEGFDYVALGHIHKSQQAGNERIRYCGTPLKYSFSEALQQKSLTVVELKEKGHCTLRTVDLIPLRELRSLKGPFAKLTDPALVQKTEDYVFITLTDEEEVLDGAGKLRLLYPNLMGLTYDNTRTRAEGVTEFKTESKSPMELFEQFYEAQNGAPMNDHQRDYMQALTEQLGEEQL